MAVRARMVRWSFCGGLGRLLGCSGLVLDVWACSSINSGFFFGGVLLRGLGVVCQWSDFLLFFLSVWLIVGFLRF